jgi:hypothetical protein
VAWGVWRIARGGRVLVCERVPRVVVWRWQGGGGGGFAKDRGGDDDKGDYSEANYDDFSGFGGAV